jgi:hypothetical protein
MAYKRKTATRKKTTTRRKTTNTGKTTRKIGGTNFTVTMCSTSKTEAADKAERLRKTTGKKVRVIKSRGTHCVYVGGKSKTATKVKARTSTKKRTTKKAA